MDKGQFTEQAFSWFKQNARIIGGIFAVILGTMLILNSKELLGNLVIFALGLILINYGFRLVGWKPATDFIDKQLENFKNKLKLLSGPRN